MTEAKRSSDADHQTPAVVENRHPAWVLMLVTLALIAFAANSILARLALTETAIDPISFTAVRLVSGALMLVLIVYFLRARPKARTTSQPTAQTRVVSAAALLAYALLFSLAYVSITAATGALLLFGAVQLSMLGWTVFRGERLEALAWCGVGLALAGLIWLLLPGLERPPLWPALMMVGAGIAWAVYTLQGRGQDDPTESTASNFVLAAVPISLYALIRYSEMSLDTYGLVLAVLSGALASGLGYVIWYAALPRIRTRTAAVAQLQVPVITALAGVVLLSEPLSLRLVLAGSIILGGIILVIAPWRRRR